MSPPPDERGKRELHQTDEFRGVFRFAAVSSSANAPLPLGPRRSAVGTLGPLSAAMARSRQLWLVARDLMGTPEALVRVCSSACTRRSAGRTRSHEPPPEFSVIRLPSAISCDLVDAARSHGCLLGPMLAARAFHYAGPPMIGDVPVVSLLLCSAVLCEDLGLFDDDFTRREATMAQGVRCSACG